MRAYPAAQWDGGYITGSPDRLCYLIVREPGATTDLDDPRQVLFPRESDEPAESASAPGPGATPTPPLPVGMPTVPLPEDDIVQPVLTLWELDGVTVDTDEVTRDGLEPGQEVQITLQVVDADGGLAYLALVAEDGTEFAKVECENGLEQECTLISTLIAPSTYSTTLRLLVIAVDDVGTETGLATVSLTTRARPRSSSSSTSGSGSSGGGGGSSGSRRVRLEIEPPEQLGPFIADIPVVVYPSVDYTGRYRLYFTLPQAPEGMVIDPDRGLVTWTPQEEDEGRSFDLTITVTDGTLVDEATFEIMVMDPRSIRSSITRSETDGNVLIITDPDTNLEGLSITSPEDEPPITIRTLAELQKIFELAPEENVPEVPSWITPLTDVFLGKGEFETPVELRLPIGELVDDLPEGTQFTDVNLYAYAEISEVDGLYWSPVSVGFSFEGDNLDDLTYIMSLEGMQGLAFFGFHVNEPAMPFQATPQNMSYPPDDGDEHLFGPENRPVDIAMRVDPLNPNGGVNPIHAGPHSIDDRETHAMCESWTVAGAPLCPEPPPVEDIDCKFVEWTFLLVLKGGAHRCTYEDDEDVDIWIRGWGEGCRWLAEGGEVNQHTGCPWGRSPHDIVSWLIGAQAAAEELGLGYDRNFEVHIHPMNLGFTLDHVPAYTTLIGFFKPDALGFVASLEGRKVLHITDDNTNSYELIKFVALHEYFHHLQGHSDTVIAGSRNKLSINKGGPGKWLSEGTAQWFASEVYGDLESEVYGDLEAVFVDYFTTGARIMEVGLDSLPESNDKRKNAYERGLFFKFLFDKCNIFHSNVRALLNDRSGELGVQDKTGSHNLNNVIAASDCDFGNHLDQGEEDRSDNIETAITYYQYATQFRTQLSLLYETSHGKLFDLRHDSSNVLDPPLIVLPTNVPEGEPFVYRLSLPPFNDPVQPTPFSIPSTGAYSVEVGPTLGSMPNSAVTELVVVPVAGDLIVSMVAYADRVNRDDFNAMNTIGRDEDLHAWFSTAETRSYVISKTTVPEFTFTVVNPSPNQAVEANIFVMIRDELDVPHPEDLVSPSGMKLSVDRDALVDLYNGTDGPNWYDNQFWLAEDDAMNQFRVNTWHGVYTDEERRVIALTLSDNNLSGVIPASLGNLDKLGWLHLAFNELDGEIPEALGDLEALRSLDLRNNKLDGSIPASLGKLSKLDWLDLSENDLTGSVPVELETLAELNGLALNENGLTGEIPSGLGKLEELETLTLYSNKLTGEIPTDLGTLTNLQDLILRGNELTGEIPEEMGQLDELVRLDLRGNLLTGGIPEDFEKFTNLQYLNLERNNLGGDESGTLASLFSGFELRGRLLWIDLGYNNFEGDIPSKVYSLIHVSSLDLSNNQFTGPISDSIDNLMSLQRLDLGDNDLTGELPAELGDLHNLERLYLDDNQFTDAIPTELGDLGNLEDLRLNENMLTGAIPTELGDLYSLERLYLHENQLDGSIPASLGDLYNLERLYLHDNDLDGSIPAELGSLGDQSVLDELRLENNQLSGAIPSELGDLVSLTELNLGSNSLDGAIPTALGDLANLEELLLNNNGLTGAIPAELGDLAALTDLDLSHNQLAQAIPTDLGDLSLLESLRLNNNALADPIPTELGGLANLRILHLNSNQLTGAIPTELGQLTNLEELVLDSNTLVSTIPAELANLTNLDVLRLSGNTITGCIPPALHVINDNDLSSLGLVDCQ